MARESEPLISIIIPVYNMQDYLAECIESVLAQTYENIEVLIIDDGSTDRSGAICDVFAKEYHRITVLHTENHGLSAARNLGLEKRSKEARYIAFLDSDDWLEPDAVEKLYDATQRHDADFAACRFVREYPDHKEQSDSFTEETVLEGDDILRSLICNRYIYNYAWNKLYRAELFDRARYPEGRVHEDCVTTCRIVLAAEKTVIIPDVLMHYRVREGSLSSSHDLKNLTDFWLANYGRYKMVYTRVPDDESKAALIKSCMKAVDRMWRWYSSGSREEQKSAEHTLKEMQAFVKEHRKTVLESDKIPLRYKVICLCAMFRSKAIMSLLCHTTKVYKKIKAIHIKKGRKCIITTQKKNHLNITSKKIYSTDISPMT